MSNSETYYVNIKKDEYQKVFNNINQVFNGNYLQFISEIRATKPYLIDILILLRKYQFFLQSITLNGIEIASFYKENSGETCRLLNMKQMLNINGKNDFTFILDMLPKFKKNEIDFEIPNNLLRIEIILSVLCNENVEFTLQSWDINMTNLRDVFNEDKYNKVNKVMNKIFEALSEGKKNKPFHILNNFLNHVENYFPNIFARKKEQIKEEEKKEEWTQNEQNKLEELLVKYKNEEDIKKKMEKIAKELTSKTLKQITMRYKELILKHRKKQEEKVINKEGSVKNEIHSQKEENKELQVKNEIHSQKEENKELQVKNEIHSQKEENKELQVIKDKNSKNNQNNKKQYPIILETTDDIIDEIIRVYNEKYASLDLSLGNSNSQNFAAYSMEEEEEESEEEEEKEEEGEDQRNKDLISKNKELVDIYLSQSLQPSLKPEDLTLIQNILNFGEKYQINLLGVKMRGIATGEITSIKLLLKCSVCQKMAFESGYQRINKKDTLFYMGTTCPRCQKEIYSIFKSSYLHDYNTSIIGTAYCIGCEVFEFLPSAFTLLCYECQTAKNVKLRNGGLHINDSHCRNCNHLLEFYITSSYIAKTLTNDLYFLEKCQICNFNKFNHVIKDDIDLNNYVKKCDKVIQVGKPLPDYGTCKHYRQSFRWFRFGCCNKTFPCDECHNENNSHECEIAKMILCGYCAFEQSVNNKLCVHCGNNFKKILNASGFWQGGKGCRNQTTMSTKDSHKFTGSSMKTVSRKKLKNKQNN